MAELSNYDYRARDKIFEENKRLDEEFEELLKESARLLGVDPETLRSIDEGDKTDEDYIEEHMYRDDNFYDYDDDDDYQRRQQEIREREEEDERRRQEEYEEEEERNREANRQATMLTLIYFSNN